jgi:hypothetical protein
VDLPGVAGVQELREIAGTLLLALAFDPIDHRLLERLRFDRA